MHVDLRGGIKLLYRVDYQRCDTHVASPNGGYQPLDDYQVSAFETLKSDNQPVAVTPAPVQQRRRGDTTHPHHQPLLPPGDGP